MRIFKTESAFDSENNQWCEVYYINDQEVDQQTYFEELELEPYSEDEPQPEQCDCEDCQCPDCEEEFTDEEIENIELVEEYAKAIEEIQCECGCELRNILYALICEARQIGYEDAQIDQSANKATNIYIDTVEVNSDFNRKEFFEKIQSALRAKGGI